MQTRNHRALVLHDGLGPWIVMLTLGVLFAGGVALAAPQITLTDGDSVLDELPLGGDLYVEAFGLTPSTEVEVLLLDWDGTEVLRQPRNVGGQGTLRSKRLWYRTGIGGCDCKLWGQGYPFRDPIEARQLIGYEVAVQLLDANTGVILAQRNLTITESKGPLLFTSDVRGCPQERFETEATLMLRSTDPVDGMTVFLVPHQEEWKDGDPIVDVRPGFQLGQSFPASPNGLSGVLWQGIESEAGEYDLLIRPGTAPGQPVGLVLRPNDRLHSFFGGEDVDPGNPGDRGNSGLVIDDWGCH